MNLDDARVLNLDLGALPAPPNPCRPATKGRVMRVIDGDTFDVLIDGAGEAERVRLIGVDTPETSVPRGYPHCYGAEAKQFSEQLIGRMVALSFDVGCTDPNGRVLAYVWVGVGDGDLWQRQLLRRGLAKLLIIRPNVFMESQFREDAEVAQREGRGLWSACKLPGSP
ncbi:MAG: thermonuclease family protein [Sandaracinaceae bacterium]|nr:thermonuclease family protein [Sandaracinaceae bacterium]MDW8245707.1 thermonuclease family protein [Sandaracinaceae bacterium]